MNAKRDDWKNQPALTRSEDGTFRFTDAGQRAIQELRSLNRAQRRKLVRKKR